MFMDIRERANKLVQFYKTRNPFEIIQGMNAILIFYPLEGVRGFYQYFQRNNLIYIDEKLPEHEQMFVCAHEIGHMLLHKKSNAIFMDTRTHFNTGHYELEADTFAVNLLISDEFLLENKDYSNEQIARMLGYHERLIELRLKNSFVYSDHTSKRRNFFENQN